jgi:hypothetical protein
MRRKLIKLMFWGIYAIVVLNRMSSIEEA